LDEEQNPKLNVGAPRHRFPYSTPLYSITQMTSVILTVNLILPAVLRVSWSGTLVEEACFFLLFSIALILVSYAFLAVAGYFAIMFMVAQNLKKLTMADARSKQVAKALAIRVLLGNQPRWLISLTPCVVPAMSLAIMSKFFEDKLPFDSDLVLFQACLIQGLLSFVLCLPFTLKTQRMFNTNVLEEKPQGSRQNDE
jgi:hypothetical protein